MICDGCQKKRDDADLMRCVITEKKEFLRFARCCVQTKAGVPDVFWDGKPEINLADDERTGKPRVFSSKGEKAAYLKERGIMECGDKVRGAFATTAQKPAPFDSRRAVKEALQKVRNMGADYRRQEYLRIKKEGQEAQMRGR